MRCLGQARAELTCLAPDVPVYSRAACTIFFKK